MRICSRANSSGILFKVDGLIQNLEKEIDDVDIKIGKGWQLLDRYIDII